MIKSRRMSWAGHVVHIGVKRIAYRVLMGKPEGQRPLGRPRYMGRIIVKWFFKKYEEGVGWTEFIWLRIETSGELL
jgi:hypothetical protein